MISVLEQWPMLTEKIFASLGFPYYMGPAFMEIRRTLKEKEDYHVAALAKLIARKK